MEKDSFFDTSIIFNYASFSSKIVHPLNERCYNYIKNKKGKFIVCYFVIEEITDLKKRRKIMQQEVINKLTSFSYEIGASKIARDTLKREDIAKAKQLYEAYKGKNPKEVFSIFANERYSFERRLDIFFKFKIDEKVIPITEIDKNIMSIIQELIENYNDCRVLTSSIQEQQKRSIFFFVTSDKEHFNENYYEFVKEDPRLKKYKFPELKNLFFMDNFLD